MTDFLILDDKLDGKTQIPKMIETVFYLIVSLFSLIVSLTTKFFVSDTFLFSLLALNQEFKRTNKYRKYTSV